MRLAPLRAGKLRALVRSQYGPRPLQTARPGTLPGGATLVEGGTGRAWVLIDDGDPTSLGPVLAWAERRTLPDLHVIVEDGGVDGPGRPSCVVARRAAEWSHPPVVWRVVGAALQPASPLSAPAEPSLPAGARPYAGLLAEHGTDPVVEHGVLTGEVLGLEVARAVDGPDGWHLEVGVGRLDREARHEMRPGEPEAVAIDDVVGVVRRWRRAGAARHPANTLARERWLRAVVMDRPALAGAETLATLAPPLPRQGIRGSSAALLQGSTAAGGSVVVACSTGVDIDLVATAADARRQLAGADGDCHLVVVVPEGDDYAVTRTLAARLRRPAEVRTVGRDWPTLSR